MRKVYFAADHAGFELKNTLVAYVKGLGYDTDDCGAEVFDKNDDYPEIIARAARKLSDDARAGRESYAIVLGGSGQGEAMVANRFSGVRCAVYYGGAGEQTDAMGKKLDVISSTREHNNANALSLGARFLSLEEAKNAVRAWLQKPFPAEERNVRRNEQIDEVS